ncbi:MAG: hypothetical protein WBP49_15060 [Acidimicrobiia bacterium]|jgi:hypothetical protein
MAADGRDEHNSDADLAVQWVVRWWWLWAILALAAGGLTVAAADGFPIVDLELAWTVEQADDVTRGADVGTIRSAILWDFVFIFFYALALSTGALWARRQFRSSVGIAVGTVVAFGGVAAGIFDVVENLSMLGYLNGWSGWIALAGTMAVPKFLLALAGVVYIAAGLVLLAVRRPSR